MNTILILVALLLINLSAGLRFLPERKKPKKEKKKTREGWHKTRFEGWQKDDLPPDAPLRIGVTHRPKECTEKSKSGDILMVHYNATLWSDPKGEKLFDSSIMREEPFVFQIGRKKMIEGWERGLLNMCVEEKRKLVVPSDLAFGSIGGWGSETENRIKPNATLVYKVELLEILNEEEAAPYFVWNEI